MKGPSIPPLPRDTARAMQFNAPECQVLLLIGDQLETIVEGVNLQELDPGRQKPSGLVLQMALITFLQYAYGLSDQQAMDRVRKNIEWKYALHLPLDYAGFHPGSLCDFRKALFTDRTGLGTLQQLEVCFDQAGLFSGVPGRLADAVGLLQTVCSINRAEFVIETMRQALEAIAVRAPGWLLQIARPHWYDRFHTHDGLAGSIPGRSPEEFADAIGGDVRYLLDVIQTAEDLDLFRLPEIEQLHQVWLRQFDHTGKSLEWRATECAFCVYGNTDCGGANTSRYRYSS